MRTSTNTHFSQCGFHHIALRARNFDASLAFYTEGMGFPVAHSWGEGEKRIALLDLGDGNYLELFACPEETEIVGGNQFFHLALRSVDVDADIEKVRAQGCPITIEPKSVPVNGKTIRVGFFLGPEGETWEFFQNDEL
jgi:glyoxylase I family protein